MRDVVLKLIDVYSHTLDGLTDRRCAEEAVDHERCQALRRHLERDAYDAQGPVVTEGMLLYKAGWDAESTYEIVEGRGKDAVLDRARWLADNVVTRWYRFDYSDSEREGMWRELLSIRSVGFGEAPPSDESGAKEEGGYCPAPVPEEVTEAYHRDLRDVMLHSPNHDFSTLAAMSFDKLTAEDKAALIPELESSDDFRRGLTTAMLIGGARFDGDLFAPLLNRWLHERNEDIQEVLGIYAGHVMESEGLFDEFSPKAQDAAIASLERALRSGERDVRLNAVKMLGSILPGLDDTRRQRGADALLALSAKGDLAVRTAAMKVVARMRLAVSGDRLKFSGETVEAIDAAIVDALRTGNEGMRRAVANELAKVDELSLGRTLSDELSGLSKKDENGVVRASAALAVMRSGELSMKHALVLFRDRDPYVRRVAVVSMGRFKEAQHELVLQTLVKALGDKEPDVRAEALIQLAGFDLPELDRFQRGLGARRLKMLREEVDRRSDDICENPDILLGLLNALQTAEEQKSESVEL